MMQMTVNEIEINTSTLAGTVENLENTTSKLEEQVKKMFQTIQDLDQMWDGEANKAFNEQFQQDHKACEEMCQELREMINSFKHAREEYDKCESRVDELVRQLRV